MNICTSCIVDSELTSIIENMNILGKCDICNKENIRIYDTTDNQNQTIQQMFIDLISIYTSERFIEDEKIKAQCVYLFDDIIDRWNIFNKNVSKDTIVKIIKEILSNIKDIDTEMLFNDKVIIKELYDADFLLEHSLLYTHSWDDFIHEIKEVNRFHPTTINIDYFDKFASYLVKSYKKGDIFYRGRISENRILTKEEMMIPPFHLRTEGRAHARGIKCLYLTNDIQTVLYETRSLIYDYVNIATFEATEDFNVFDFNNINNISPFTQFINTTILAINKVHLDNIKHDISKINRRTDSVIDYVSTQFIVDYIKNIKDPLNDRPLFKGIGYVSTLSNNGYNIAMFDDKIFSCKTINLYDVHYIDYKYSKVK